MALMKCPECNNEISDRAKNCIHCGTPIDYVTKSGIIYSKRRKRRLWIILIGSIMILVGLAAVKWQLNNKERKNISELAIMDLKFYSSIYNFSPFLSQVNDAAFGQIETIAMAKWREGMKFFIVPLLPQEGKLYEKIELYPIGGVNQNQENRLSRKTHGGETMILDKIEERKVKCPRGICIRTYYIFELNGQRYEWEYIGSLDEMRNDQTNLIEEIKGIADISHLEYLKDELIGKKVWLCKRYYREDTEAFVGELKIFKAYQEVEIIDLQPGIRRGPYKMTFVNQEGDTGFEFVRFSKTNQLNVLDNTAFYLLGDDFENCFSLIRPKEKFPQIDEGDWTKISQGDIALGMSPDAVKLAIGQPDDQIGDEKNQVIVYREFKFRFKNNRLKEVSELQ